MEPTLLAIESSCDETSASVIKQGKVLNNVIATQSIHEIYGGVVPELASRAHQQVIIPVIRHAVKKAGVSLQDLDAVAFTKGPGLLGSLLVGASVAKAMALSLGIPLIGVNHMHGHILSHFIEDPRPTFPFLCLTVSGGHTQIVKVTDPLTMEVLGETLDDAVGEAFDKCAKIMGLNYPGGPLIDKYAAAGDPSRFTFPSTDVTGLDFSFSGIKTAFLYFIRDKQKEEPNFIANNLSDICASLQKHLIDMLLVKLAKAMEMTGIREIAIAGGVAANKGLRKKVAELALEKNGNVYIPDLEYCTDNAAMIAMVAHYKFLRKEFDPIGITPEARMKLNRDN